MAPPARNNVAVESVPLLTESREQLGSLGDDISSIRVFGGARVIVYNDRNFRGPSAQTRNDVSDLRGWSYGGGHAWNNRIYRISSLRVQ